MNEKDTNTPEENTPKRKKSLHRHTTLNQVLNAIAETGGIVTDTCRLLGVYPPDFYKKWRYLPEVEQAFIEAKSIGFEEVTDVLFKKALEGDNKAIKMYLQYCPLAKQNNWVENQTFTIKDDKPLTPEEKKELTKELFG